MRLVFALLCILLLGCTQQKDQTPAEKPVSEDLEVAIIAGENYSLGEPIAFQIKTTNYSIVYLNRSGGYSVGYYPSVWICRYVNGSCENVEYRRMRDFSKCVNERTEATIPLGSFEKKDFYPAEFYEMLLLWDQKEWKEEKIPCGKGFASVRKFQSVPPGNYSVTFVYWVSWDTEPRSVTADFRII